MCNRKLFYIASILWLFNLFYSTGFAQTDEKREALKGLKSLLVLVGELKTEIEQTGLLTKSIVQTDVELQLRKIGIKVLTKDEIQKLPLSSGMPCLYINANIIKSKTGYYIYNIVVQLQEYVTPIRTPSIIVPAVTTWDTSVLGLNSDLRKIRQTISNEIDIFLNDYLTVNPK